MRILVEASQKILWLDISEQVVLVMQLLQSVYLSKC